jgi:copper chaperone NosL
MKRLTMALPMLALLFLAACGRQVDTERPPEIIYGQDVCDRCGMIVNEENFAAAYWTKTGEARRFDDIGGMLAYITEESEEVATYWVHDFASGEWIRAEEATFVLDEDLMTPMGFGIAAFEVEAKAQAMAYGRDGVLVMPFSQVLAMDITMPVARMNDMNELEHQHE